MWQPSGLKVMVIDVIVTSVMIVVMVTIPISISMIHAWL